MAITRVRETWNGRQGSMSDDLSREYVRGFIVVSDSTLDGPAEIIAYLINKGKLNAKLSIVVTDLDVHAMWLCRTFHRYFVALDEAKVHLEVLGLPANNITAPTAVRGQVRSGPHRWSKADSNS